MILKIEVHWRIIEQRKEKNRQTNEIKPFTDAVLSSAGKYKGDTFWKANKPETTL